MPTLIDFDCLSQQISTLLSSTAFSLSILENLSLIENWSLSSRSSDLLCWENSVRNDNKII